MITHIVIFKLKNNDNQSIDIFKNELIKLKQLPYLEEFNVVDKNSILKTSIEGDIVLFSKFKSEAALKSYMTDTNHLAVIKNTTANILDKHTLDFKTAE